MKLPTIERLRETLAYDPDTGVIRRIAAPKRGPSRIGEIAGKQRPRGYIVFVLDWQKLYAHRVAWALYTGEWPKHEIDHINGIRSDNRIANLRDVDASVNRQNQRSPTSRSSTGHLGVSRGRPNRRKRFRAQVTHAGKQVWLGYFATAEEAHAAYVQAKRRLHEGSTL